MSDDVWLARSAAFLRVFLPVREWVACHAQAPLAEHVGPEEFGLANLHAVVTERRYLGNPVPALPESLLWPLALYLDELPGYAPDPRPDNERFSEAARQHAFVTMGVPRPLGTAALWAFTGRKHYGWTDDGASTSNDAWAACTAAFLRVFLPVRDWVARHGGQALPEHVAAEEFGLANLHAVVTARRYLGNQVPALPECLLWPLALYLDELPGYAPDPRPDNERFSAAARQHAFVTMGVPRPLAVGAP